MKLIVAVLIFHMTVAYAWASGTGQDRLKPEEFFDASIEELLEMKVTTASRREQSVKEAPANITVITREMIERRGYRNLVEILEDLPGFDFATYEDGGGEYSAHSLNRGIGGDNGNSKLMIMVDDIVQNHISFNWSLGWGNQQIFHDLERIEIIQGPGSALYGANALSGIVHFITKNKQKKNHEFYLKPWVGEDGTRAVDVGYGGKADNFHYSLALRKFNSDGDNGKYRPDPGNYFHNNVEPNILTQDYDADGNYNTDVTNPTAGRALPDGFNTSKDDLGLRGNVYYFNPDENLEFGTKKAGIGFSYWNKEDGLGSYVPGFEYFMADPGFIVHHRAYHVYGKHDLQLSGRINLKSFLWYRENKQMPDTGFVYTYRFHDMPKTYHSSSSQAALEEQLHFKFSEDSNFIAGVRFMNSKKMAQVVSLNRTQSSTSSSTTDSSWDLASDGSGLYQTQSLPKYHESERAFYGVFDKKINQYASLSLGARHDSSTEFDSTINPRLGLMLNPPVKDWGLPLEEWGVKLLYGTAFRQPSIFELQDEFRGNSSLNPERITTYELENNINLFSNNNRDYFQAMNIKFNIFFSELKDIITLVPDATTASGERYDNGGKFRIRGISANVDLQTTEDLSFYFNYILTQGKEEDGNNWADIDHTAKHKVNAGFNFLTLYDYLNVNFRLNYVGKRKVPSTNSYFTDHAPGYIKANLVLTGKNIGRKWWRKVTIEPQLIVKNLFDTDYYGVGRQGGSSDRTLWDPDTNPNPSGFIPPYHPQPGRTFLFNVKCVF